MSIDLISNGESGLSARNKINGAIDQLNSGSFDIVYATNNGNGTNYSVGDDIWIGDVNIANTMQLKGQQNATKAYIKFGSGSSNPIVGSSNNGKLEITGSLSVTFGITGSLFGTSSYALLANTASYVQTAQTASYVVLAQTASYVLNAVSASYATTSSYVNPLSQDVIITGSLTITGSNQDLYLYGRKQFNYGVFQNNTTLSGSANVSHSFKLDTTDESHEINIVSGSQITFTNAGVYDIQFSAQVAQGAGSAIIYIWFKRNGTNIPESATVLDVASNKFVVAAWNFMKTFNAGDYVELAWQSDQNSTTFPFIPASGNIPTVPSIIVTVTQVR